jgi:hypothetical protein
VLFPATVAGKFKVFPLEKGDEMRPHSAEALGNQDDEGEPLDEGAPLKLGLLEGGEEGCAESHWATKMASSNARHEAQTVDLRKVRCSSHRLARRGRRERWRARVSSRDQTTEVLGCSRGPCSGRCARVSVPASRG